MCRKCMNFTDRQIHEPDCQTMRPGNFDGPLPPLTVEVTLPAPGGCFEFSLNDQRFPRIFGESTEFDQCAG